MGIARTVLISTIDLRNPKSFCKNLSLRKFKKTKIPIFPLYFWEYSLVKIKVQFWEGRWPRIKKFRKRKLLSTKFYRRKHLSQIIIWFFIFLTHPIAQYPFKPYHNYKRKNVDRSAVNGSETSHLRRHALYVSIKNNVRIILHRIKHTT